MSDLIGPEEAGLIQAALSEINSEPPPTDSGPYGCMLALVALVGLVALPIVAARVGLTGTPLTVATAFLLGSIPGGLVWSMFGGAFSRGKVISAVDQAATELIELHPDGPTDRMLALATRIIANAHISTGPSTSTAYKAEEMAERLGLALPYVLRVERWLVEHKGVYPVFTMSDDADDEGD